MKNRKEKITFLKQIIKGQVSLTDLKPKQLELHIGGGKDGNNKYMINGLEVSEQEYHNELTKHPPKSSPEFWIGPDEDGGYCKIDQD